MKLAPVLTKYLSNTKQLSLPGIGTFHLENAYDPDYDGKKAAPVPKITFRQEKVEKASDDLIDFIATETGKMRVLAISDFSSQLEDLEQFVNTGKPYFIPGIGTLAKKTDGNFDFFPEKAATSHEKSRERSTPITEKNTIPQAYIDENRKRPSVKPAITIITLSIIAIAATVWFYIKNTEEQQAATQDITNVDTPGTTSASASDSATRQSAAIAAPAPATYTYVLEMTKEPRATKRFNQLKTINWPVELEIVDSTFKRIIMKLPIAGADSARIRDSLSVLSGRKVVIAP